jgi:hypothetical protein
MTTDNFCFYLQNRLIQTSQIGGQQYSDISPLVFPGQIISPADFASQRVLNGRESAINRSLDVTTYPD